MPPEPSGSSPGLPWHALVSRIVDRFVARQPHVNVGRDSRVERDTGTFAFYDVGRVGLVKLDDRARPDLETVEPVKLLIAAGIHVGDPRHRADLQLRQRHDRLFDESVGPAAALSLMKDTKTASPPVLTQLAIRFSHTPVSP